MVFGNVQCEISVTLYYLFKIALRDTTHPAEEKTY